MLVSAFCVSTQSQNASRICVVDAYTNETKLVNSYHIIIFACKSHPSENIYVVQCDGHKTVEMDVKKKGIEYSIENELK